MKLYMHQGFGGIAWFVGLDAEKTIDRMWEEFDELKKYEKNPYFIREETRLSLDPGGLLHIKIPFIHFTMDGVDFQVQPHQADHVKWQLEHRVVEDMEDIVCAKMGISTLIIPRTLRDKLVIKLDAISKSDVALHASITLSEAREKINQSGYGAYLDGPVDIGNGQTVDIAELRNQRRKEENL